MKQMSLSEKIQNEISKFTDNYCSLLAETLKMDKQIFIDLLGKVGEGKKPKVEKPVKAGSQPSEPVELTLSRLTLCNLTELKALCKERNKKVGGKKQELIDRLLDKDSEILKAKVAPAKSKKTLEIPVIKTVVSNVSAIPVHKNSFGNIEHGVSGLVFDKKSEMVIGKQNDDGSIDELTDADIQVCKQYKFEYKIPENLDENNDDANIKELDSDSDSEIIIEDSDEDIIIEDDSDDDEEDGSSEEDE